MYGVGNTAGTPCSWEWSIDNFGNPPGSQTGVSGVYSTPAYSIAVPGTIGTVGSASYTDGVVYETGKDGQTYALDPATGAQIWAFNIKKTIKHGNPVQSGAALVGNAVYIGYGAGVFSLNATTGALNWTSPVAAPVISSVSVTGPTGKQPPIGRGAGAVVDRPRA
jgi:outer membrane protein assembly factor BamB